MRTLLFLLCVVYASTLRQRIAGGEKSALGDFPHSVAIRNRADSIVYCAGSIIHKRHVLTAAHWYVCYYSYSL
jgi:secreted trypsin-like serine protease